MVQNPVAIGGFPHSTSLAICSRRLLRRAEPSGTVLLTRIETPKPFQA